MDVVIPAVVTALAWIAAGLLVVAGVGKLPVPDGAMATLHSLRLPSGRVAARLVGMGEVAVGIAVIVVGGRVGAGLLAVVYALLLAVAWRQRVRQLDCGCFGVAAAPVSPLHLGVNAGAAATGVLGLAIVPLPLSEVATDAGILGTFAGLLVLATGVALVRAMAVSAAEQLRTAAPASASGAGMPGGGA